VARTSTAASLDAYGITSLGYLFVLPDLQLQHQREPRSTEATMTVRSWHRRPRGLVSRRA